MGVAFGQGGKRAARPEGIAHITNGAFHTPFLIAPAYLARLRREMIMSAALDQARVELDEVAAAFQLLGNAWKRVDEIDQST